MSLRLIIADDHKIMREGLRSLLEKEPGIEIVAEADNGLTVIDLAEELKPDVIVMDVTMPGLNGIDATRRIKANQPETKVIALSVHSDKHFIAEMFKAGAIAYLLKQNAFSELTRAIKVASEDDLYLSPKISSIAIEALVTNDGPLDPSGTSFLSGREREILQLLAEGKSAKNIADKFYLSVKTIETHRKNIMKKLNLYNLADLTKYAIRHGLTTLEQ